MLVSWENIVKLQVNCLMGLRLLDYRNYLKLLRASTRIIFKNDLKIYCLGFHKAVLSFLNISFRIITAILHCTEDK